MENPNVLHVHRQMTFNSDNDSKEKWKTFITLNYREWYLGTTFQNFSCVEAAISYLDNIDVVALVKAAIKVNVYSVYSDLPGQLQCLWKAKPTWSNTYVNMSLNCKDILAISSDPYDSPEGAFDAIMEAIEVFAYNAVVNEYHKPNM